MPVYNRTHIAGANLRKIQPGSGTSEVGSFSKLGLPNTHMDEVALSRASTRCQSSLETGLRILL